MRAVVISPNSPAHLAIQEVASPAPAPNEALVRVATISLNLGEVRYAASRPAGARIGWDLAGTVEQAAADGSGPQAGARVAALMPTGAWAELVAVPTSSLGELPPEVSFAQAATLPVAGLTALHAVEQASGLLGRNALVTGASGGVGLFACQIARLMGARVVGIIRQPQHEALVRDAGAHEVVVSEDGEAARQSGPYRLVVEGVGGPMLANTLTMLGPDGVCVVFASTAGAEANLRIGAFMGQARARIYSFVLFNEFGRETAAVGLGRLARLVAEGRLRVHIDVESPWSEIGVIAEQLLERKIAGKAVLHVG